MTRRQRMETAALQALVILSRALGPVRASNLGSAVARFAGPLLPVSRIADRNLTFALPDLDAAARRRIVRAAWDNLGRTVAELPHVAFMGPTAAGPGWEVARLELIQPLQEKGARGIMFSGHFANWEVMFASAWHHGIDMAAFYRAAANPGVNRLMMELRRPDGRPAAPMFAKGAAGARAALVHLRDGGVIGFLMDQKMNDGVPATLFGHRAMTASALASMALRYRCPVIPAKAERIGPARFRIVVEPALDLPDTGDRAQDLLTLTQAVNDRLEHWIRSRPGEWLLMHRRFPKEVYR